MGQNGLNGYQEDDDKEESTDCLPKSEHTNGRYKIFCLKCQLSQHTHVLQKSVSQQKAYTVLVDTVYTSLCVPVSQLLTCQVAISFPSTHIANYNNLLQGLCKT